VQHAGLLMSREVGVAAEQSPTVRRHRLGTELRQLRKQAGLTLEQASAQLTGMSAAKISRIETAKVSVTPGDVERLLSIYGVDDPERHENLKTLTRESRQSAWWQEFANAIPTELDRAIGLEAEAVSIRIFSPNFVGGLFQTRAYARALLAVYWTSESEEQLERRVEVRMERQKILTQPKRPRIWAVIDETVLSRPVGGEATLRDQLLRLIELAKAPNVSLRVLPRSVGAHPGGEGPFRIIDLRPPDPSSVHFEYPTKASYIDKVSEVNLYRNIFKRLVKASLPLKQSLARIEESLQELNKSSGERE
jgi:transcriptional regulator with XRE-family HTH domain